MIEKTYSSSEKDSFEEELSFKNMVTFYCNELLKIELGVSATELFGRGIRKQFQDRGILYYNHRERCYLLSNKAKLVLMKNVCAHDLFHFRDV